MQGPDAPFQEPERRRLIEEISGNMKFIFSLSTARAALWLADIEKLREFAQVSEDSLGQRLLGIESLRIVEKCKAT